MTGASISGAEALAPVAHTNPLVTRSRLSFWMWFLQRMSAIALAPLLFAHMVVNHFVDPGTTLTVADVEANLQQITFVLLDSVLLLAGLFHGLNGLRNVLNDYINDLQWRQRLGYAITILGVLLWLFGMAIIFTVVGRV